MDVAALYEASLLVGCDGANEVLQLQGCHPLMAYIVEHEWSEVSHPYTAQGFRNAIEHCVRPALIEFARLQYVLENMAGIHPGTALLFARKMKSQMPFPADQN